MKKITTLFVVTMGTMLFSCESFAKTEGHYVGLNIIKTDVKPKEYKSNSTGTLTNSDAYNIKGEDKVSFGLSYKYAFNFDKFFLAPGVFYDHSKISMSDDYSQKWDLNYRYGFRVDAGYDFTNEFSAYALAGSAINNVGLSNNTGFKDTANDSSLFYGLGIKYALSKKVTINLEYEQSDYDADLVFTNGTTASQNFDSSIIRLGVSYKF